MEPELKLKKRNVIEILQHSLADKQLPSSPGKQTASSHDAQNDITDQQAALSHDAQNEFTSKQTALGHDNQNDITGQQIASGHHTQNEVRYKLIIDPSEDESITRLLFVFGILKRENTRTYICSNFLGDGQLQKVKHNITQCVTSFYTIYFHYRLIQ